MPTTPATKEKNLNGIFHYMTQYFFLDQRKGQQSLTQDLIPNDIPTEILDYLTTQIVCHVREKNSSDEVLFSAFIPCFRLCRCSSRHNRKYAREKLVKDGYQKNKIKKKSTRAAMKCKVVVMVKNIHQGCIFFEYNITIPLLLQGFFSAIILISFHWTL